MATTGPQGLEILVPTNYQPTQPNVEIDVIAVPGLGADPSRSFGSETPRGFNWLTDEREGIHADIPKSRVMLYHYDSRWLGTQSKEQTIYNVATLLLESIIEKRKSTEEGTRPIVFLAHSMGGLVVAKALVLAAQQRDRVEYMRVIECFAGCVFFGTPFGGSSAQAPAYLLATFLEKVGRAVPNQMLQLLDPERDSLEELRRDFVKVAFKEPKAKLVCYYELEATNYIQEKVSAWVPKNYFKAGPREIVVTKKSAVLDGSVDRGMSCNHRQLNRFDSAKDGRYENVRHQIRDIVKDAQKIVRARLKASRQSAIDDATFARLSESLNVVEFQRKLRSVKTLSGDSSWILKEPKYLHWRTQQQLDGSNRVPCLWVSGDEGLGKSKAAATVIQELQERESENEGVMVAYFFCDPTPDCSKPENVLKSLMWQLILARRSLAHYVRAFAAQDSKKLRGSGQGTEEQFSLSRLWKGLTEMLRDPSVHEVYLVVNNVHHLSSELPATVELLKHISASLFEAAEVGINDPIREKARWMLLSRDRDNMRQSLIPHGDGYESPTLWLNLNDSSMSNVLREQVRSFTRDRVKELAKSQGYNLALQYFVFSSLEKRAESNNVWVEVVCRLLEGIPPAFNLVRKALESLPQDPLVLINRTWAEVLNSADHEDLETTKEILRTLAITFEEPTTDELVVLAGLEIEEDDDESHDDKVLAKIHACGPLLRTYDTETWEESGYAFSTRVAFTHPMARDALLTPDMKRLIGLAGADRDEETEVRWQHGIIGLRCFTYILNVLGASLEDSEITLERTAPSAENQADAEIDDLFPDDDDEGSVASDEGDSDALEYPLKYWLEHGHLSTADFVATLDIKHRFWSVDSTARRRWWAHYARREEFDNHKNMTALHIAAYFGSLPLVNSLLESGHEHEIHAHDTWDNQPLHWAADRGHASVCEKLIEKGADINDGIGTRAWTPLHMAASSGQSEVIACLLAHNAQINAIADEVGTPLTLAIMGRQYHAAETLLRYGADTTSAAANSEPPVAAAALRGSENLVHQLLNGGGAGNLASHEFGSALAAAASVGNPNIVQTLLPIDTDPASRQSALEQAASGGFHGVVIPILHNTPNLPCDKAFELAAYGGHDDVVRELWAYGSHYRTISPAAVGDALYQASDMQRETTVQFLLQYCRVDPNTATGDEYGNALTASAYDGTTSILQMLLQYGARVDAPEGFPLQAAALNGHTEIVTILLDHGAHPNAFSDGIAGGTALQAACTTGNTDVAKALLARGADPNYGDGEFTNPLIAATSIGYGDIVELLLGYRANPNVFGGFDGSTPLNNAAMSLPAKYLIMLMDYGAFVDQMDPDEDTALMVSALVGDNDCVEALLARGANVHLIGKHYGSALHAAASGGHTETCRLLLQRGADPRVRGGPFGSVLQAAVASGNPKTVEIILAACPKKTTGSEIDSGSKFFTALHAAAVQEDDSCLRQLLSRKPNLNMFPPATGNADKGLLSGTPLQIASLAGCNRNARLLLEAGADPNIVAGKHATALQGAALKGSSALVELLIAHGARIDAMDKTSKYGHALVAAVARPEDDSDRLDVLESLLGQEGIPAAAYKSALQKAFRFRDKAVFKQVLAGMRTAAAKNVKKFPNIKGMLGQFKKMHVERDESGDANSDFGDDVVFVWQDIDDDDFDDHSESGQQRNGDVALQHPLEDGNPDGPQEARSVGGGAERSLPFRPQQASRGGGELQGRSQQGGVSGDVPYSPQQASRGGRELQDRSQQGGAAIDEPYSPQATTRGGWGAQDQQSPQATTRGGWGLQDQQQGGAQASRGAPSWGAAGAGVAGAGVGAGAAGAYSQSRGFDASNAGPVDEYYGDGGQDQEEGHEEGHEEEEHDENEDEEEGEGEGDENEGHDEDEEEEHEQGGGYYDEEE
ncbi:ankyrin repeat-containing domain protein [Cercophora newfieldiana]|uniref:Ankyrin repeat-containing domain protein n=1 Tax=Cercophora newfieldiana TaxID=92897 RepID=A0AA39XS29_9PEZI|nr:ankyrin repeat-containing domain protein [Cercophora newfieldiana]